METLHASEAPSNDCGVRSLELCRGLPEASATPSARGDSVVKRHVAEAPRLLEPPRFPDVPRAREARRLHARADVLDEAVPLLVVDEPLRRAPAHEVAEAGELLQGLGRRLRRLPAARICAVAGHGHPVLHHGLAAVRRGDEFQAAAAQAPLLGQVPGEERRARLEDLGGDDDRAGADDARGLQAPHVLVVDHLVVVHVDEVRRPGAQSGAKLGHHILSTAHKDLHAVLNARVEQEVLGQAGDLRVHLHGQDPAAGAQLPRETRRGVPDEGAQLHDGCAGPEATKRAVHNATLLALSAKLQPAPLSREALQASQDLGGIAQRSMPKGMVNSLCVLVRGLPRVRAPWYRRLAGGGLQATPQASVNLICDRRPQALGRHLPQHFVGNRSAATSLEPQQHRIEDSCLQALRADMLYHVAKDLDFMTAVPTRHPQQGAVCFPAECLVPASGKHAPCSSHLAPMC
mmetsp:Transcript_18721/g.52908  ORF Transcript_18721/g.52908 Transcript_18721/m.52908 type:complete len:460 (-) Transcript_18721:933-2312(-)